MKIDFNPLAWLFDFDGVLADSREIHQQAWETACLQLFGSKPHSQLEKSHFGQAAPEIASNYASSLGFPNRGMELLEHKSQLVIAQAPGMPALPGALDLLHTLETTKAPWGVASNAPRPVVLTVLQAWGFKNPLVIGWQETPNPKPAPDPWLACTRLLGFDPGDTPKIVAFDDSPYGLEGAVRAGCYSVGIAPIGSSQAQALVQIGANLILPDLGQVNPRLLSVGQ
jgi:HAD superfamily hydrolase (TIGR01509 family)